MLVVVDCFCCLQKLTSKAHKTFTTVFFNKNELKKNSVSAAVSDEVMSFSVESGV